MAELASLMSLLQEVNLTQGLDSRTMLHGSKFSTKNAYLNLQDTQRDDSTSCIWESRAPARVKIFAWLMHLDKLNTRQKLHHKGFLDTPYCPACPQIIEDKIHLLFESTVAQQIWLKLGLQPLHAGMTNIWKLQPSTQLPASVWPTILLAILWKIWDTRVQKCLSIHRPSLDSHSVYSQCNL
jgi:hypothetical protein